MHAMNKLGMVALVAAVGMLVGCEKTFKITITNATPQARQLEMTDPVGTQSLGLLEPGRSRHYSVKLPNNELPANFELNAGGAKKAFTLDKKDNDQQYIYLDASGIVGPTPDKREYRESKRIETRTITTGGPVITGQPVPPAVGGDGSGGGVIIDQREVVE